MSEDLIGKLARFTPAATGIDRDAWLFQAGRASAPSPRWWQRAVGLLVVTQALTLAVWLTRPRAEPEASQPPSMTPGPMESEYSTQPTDDSPAPSSYLILARSDLTRPPQPEPGSSGSTRTQPPLTAGWRGEPID